ncbi:NAD(P)-dependent oxidoreductase [Clostridium celatum]|mgnify:CR=1 FL=1|uniref:Pyridine nucleotide-disulfide oxidoreductase n=1 Tax=Clostridium celatum DSM 1785 TaxID=545697 RepID=L1QK72_9CLOT|nr:NAD(P)-dependent oxidoreductase [Clostridium celatum]EKY28326.1 pyridine nucleotide-disulfide oxidoreductase [Clostridium celatum DSM 1785]MCE9655272.1 NAD(P)-dependent oxidoreductase [Clostridium celatum]MDU2265474.1 NAD(P)-dependent oxidoreductase [Clostridium celatum]MDU6295204.1 NAD(P)-dependent oxidoreductase [Clostridium celatum]MDY3361175.1 NAD(P)-dependent oxidoreductase [Clostridium celatum]
MKKLLLEADRCLLCKNPRCKNNCPISTEIPEVIQMFKENKIMEAGKVLFDNNPLSSVCAIVCPHEDQCKGNCIRGIKSEPVSFCEIEEYISNEYLYNLKFEDIEKKDESIAIIGAGPAGITLSIILARRGYKVTLFDAHEKIGGVLRYGIPEYRLPNSIIDRYEEILIGLGVKIRPNTLIGPVITLDKLFFDGYKAVFIGTGVWNPKTLNIKGESLGNVHYAIDYLKSPNVYKLGKKVAVIGAGNVAMDAARVAKRNGAEEVYILYRKGFENMPCTKFELEEAKEDGIKFELFKAPIELTEDGVKYIETKNEITEDGRVNTVTLEGTEGVFECDSIIIAVSQSPRKNIVANTTGLETNKWGLLLTDEKGHTTRKGVFASGDVVTGANTVVHAVAYAKVVADSIEEYCLSARAEK